MDVSRVVVKFQQVRAAVTCSEAERVGSTLLHRCRAAAQHSSSRFVLTAAVNMMVHGDGDRKTDAYGGAGKGTTSLVSDIAGLESAIAKLQTMLTTVSTYVDGVVVRCCHLACGKYAHHLTKRCWCLQAGEVEPDISLGRRIADTLASVPSVDPRVFDKMFNDSLQDLLMVRTRGCFCLVVFLRSPYASCADRLPVPVDAYSVGHRREVDHGVVVASPTANNIRAFTHCCQCL